MRKTVTKLWALALLLYIGTYVTSYIASIPPQPDVFIIEDPPWTVWEYLSLAQFLLALSFTIAAIKLRGR
jgi:hypothetical protein